MEWSFLHSISVSLTCPTPSPSKLGEPHGIRIATSSSGFSRTVGSDDGVEICGILHGKWWFYSPLVHGKVGTHYHTPYPVRR